MYEQFYGLSEKPFSLTPNPKFVFQSEQYRAAEEALLYGVGQKEGFMLVTGAPGTGKTTLCRDLLEKLDPQKYRVALIFNPFLNGVEMLHALLSEFGLGDHSATSSRKELLDRLNHFLLQQLADGRTCIAIFDEAQHLSTEFLEQIRVLSNLETDREKLIQIILVGQPELLTLIRTPQMAQLDQRVSVRCTLMHLSRDEVGRYIYHRLNVAGARGQIKFQDPAVRLIHAATGGVPRLVNLAADRALLAGYAEQARAITETHVRQGLASIRGEDGIDDKAVAQPQLLGNPRRLRWTWIAGGAAAAALLVLAVLWWRLDGVAEILAVRAARAASTSEAEETYARPRCFGWPSFRLPAVPARRRWDGWRCWPATIPPTPPAPNAATGCPGHLSGRVTPSGRATRFARCAVPPAGSLPQISPRWARAARSTRPGCGQPTPREPAGRRRLIRPRHSPRLRQSPESHCYERDS
jgi:general secretion pathway protein A